MIKRPMIWTRNPSRMVVSGLIKSVAPFGCIVWAIFRSHFWQTPANLESSFSILTNEPHEAGWTSIWQLRYWTTALPVMLSAVSLSGHVERCSIFFFYCSGISAWVKDKRVISALPWRFLWEPSDRWLFHGMKSWLTAEKEELNQSQCWKRGAILLKWKVVFY